MYLLACRYVSRKSFFRLVVQASQQATNMWSGLHVCTILWLLSCMQFYSQTEIENDIHAVHVPQ